MIRKTQLGMMLLAVLAVGMMTMLVMPAYAAAPGSPRDQFNSGITSGNDYM